MPRGPETLRSRKYWWLARPSILRRFQPPAERIELGEIEAVLASHPGIRGAVVTLHGENEQRKLSAYIVAAQEDVPTGDEVRKCLRSKLPEHMLPAIYWRLDQFTSAPQWGDRS